MKYITQIIFISLLALFVTIAPIAVYKHVTKAQQELIQQTVAEYDSIHSQIYYN